MKTFKSSDLTHKRAEVLEAAKREAVVIQQLETNGKVRGEFVLCRKSTLENLRVGVIDIDDMEEEANCGYFPIAKLQDQQKILNHSLGETAAIMAKECGEIWPVDNQTIATDSTTEITTTVPSPRFEFDRVSKDD